MKFNNGFMIQTILISYLNSGEEFSVNFKVPFKDGNMIYITQALAGGVNDFPIPFSYLLDSMSGSMPNMKREASLSIYCAGFWK